MKGAGRRHPDPLGEGLARGGVGPVAPACVSQTSRPGARMRPRCAPWSPGLARAQGSVRHNDPHKDRHDPRELLLPLGKGSCSGISSVPLNSPFCTLSKLQNYPNSCPPETPGSRTVSYPLAGLRRSRSSDPPPPPRRAGPLRPPASVSRGRGGQSRRGPLPCESNITTGDSSKIKRHGPLRGRASGAGGAAAPGRPGKGASRSEFAHAPLIC